MRCITDGAIRRTDDAVAARNEAKCAVALRLGHVVQRLVNSTMAGTRTAPARREGLPRGSSVGCLRARGRDVRPCSPRRPSGDRTHGPRRVEDARRRRMESEYPSRRDGARVPGRARPRRSTPIVHLDQISRESRDDPRQARVPEPRRLGEGSHRPGDDEAAERAGCSSPGGTIVSRPRATPASRSRSPRGQGLPLHLVMPDKMSQESRILQAYGAEVVIAHCRRPRSPESYY